MRSQTLGLALSLVVLAFGSLIAQAPSSDVSKSRPLILGRFASLHLRFGLERAIVNAARRLVDPECERVLSDFRDNSGRPLLTSLEARGVSAGEFLLRWLRFVDGSDQSFCHGPHDRVAFTSPGTYVIYICGANPHAVATFSATSPNAEAVVIHEMLHALGLGENPPTSSEITQRVLSRCYGRRRTPASVPRRERRR